MKLFCPPEHFETNKMLARRLQITDAPDVFQYLLSDPHVTWHLPFTTHLSLNETRAYINLCELGWRAGLFYVWGLADKASGRVIALVEIRAHLPRVEIGLMTTQQNKVKRRSAVALIVAQILDWLTAQPDVYRIYSCCDAHSEAARSIQHLGFHYETQLAGWEARPNQHKAAGTVNTYALLRPFEGWLNNSLRAQLLKKQ